MTETLVSFEDALARVLTHTGGRPGVERVPLAEAIGRILASPVLADRDQPPFRRSTRDGFAVRAADTKQAGATLQVIAEVAAGSSWSGQVGTGEAVEIMTGAPVPSDADAVVMVEHAQRLPGHQVALTRAATLGENIVPQGAEARSGEEVLAEGSPLGVAALGLLASLGVGRPSVFARPRVALVTTGDELVPVLATPSPVQIRNSNAVALGAQITEAGGLPLTFPITRDDPAALAAILRAARKTADLVLITGGVSAGKHDHVEPVLAGLGARTVFTGVKIRPGKPLVFGFVPDGVREVPFFGLPGNPLSTFVTFELFVRAALARLAGAAPQGGHGQPRWVAARLGAPFVQRPLPLRVFAPARWQPHPDGPPLVQALGGQGSGDLATLARAQVLINLPPETGTLAAGAEVLVLPLVR